MKAQQQPNVAVLLATYNGARFVEAQVRSLAENATPFTLHWLDDHSTDNTREIVRSSAASAGIELAEWHQPRPLGVPATFYELIERVDADIYFFSDQDDIWQRGKIDATVANLLPDVTSPVFAFSDPLLFYEDKPEVFHPLSQMRHIKFPAMLEPLRALMATPAAGQSIAITGPLREIYLRHKDIVRTHAYMHSWWLFLLAAAVGEIRLLVDVPKTLYRQHGANVTTPFYRRNQTVFAYVCSKWHEQKLMRPGMARQAKGFMLAAPTLPPGPKLDRLLALAPLVADMDRRQSPITLARLLFCRAMWPSWHHSFWMIAACLWSDAKPINLTPPRVSNDEASVSAA